jgi:hypothetical protein
MSGNVLEQPKDSQTLLLRSIAEQLKMPLMYVARQAELGRQNTADLGRSLEVIETHADMALRLVDSYLLSLDLTSKQLSLELEPVPIAATLYDVAHDLAPIAKQRNTDIELVLAGKYGQVMAHPTALKAALYGLGFVLSEVNPPGKIRNTLRIAAHRTRGGIVSGLYVEGVEDLSANIGYSKLTQTTFLRQPFPDLTASTGAGVFVAETIFGAMQSRLRPGRFQSQQGLAATLQPNRQLQLV